MAYRLGKYFLQKHLKAGGMAEVYVGKAVRSEDSGASLEPRASPILALKCIRTLHGADPSIVNMFIEEAKLSVQLAHPNIARVVELGRIGGRYFIAMEYISGRDLRSVVDRSADRPAAFSQQLMLQVAAEVLEGLDYAHRKTSPTGAPMPIVHRDVSPQNVLLGFAGEVKLIDFGIAKVMSNPAHSRVLKGKYGYMSPEQVRGEPVDPRSDVFSAGALLYELLTKKRLFTGQSELSVMEKVRNAEVYPPTLVDPSIWPEAEAVVLKALQRDAEQRFASASDMRDAISEILVRRGKGVSPRPLAAAMQELFGEELSRERADLDALGSVGVMPPDAEPLENSQGPGSQPRVLSAQDVTDVDRALEGAFDATQVHHELPEPQRRSWTEAMIVGAAALVAVLLVVVAWLSTH